MADRALHPLGDLTNVYQRLGVTDRTQAALWAQRQAQQHHEP